MMDVEHAKALAEKATPGPWEMYDANEGTDYRPMWSIANEAFHNPPIDEEDVPWIAVDVHVGGREDAEFIADARSAVPALVAAVERVQAIATEWATQPTDYDEDTEQQIEDGKQILAILEALETS